MKKELKMELLNSKEMQMMKGGDDGPYSPDNPIPNDNIPINKPDTLRPIPYPQPAPEPVPEPQPTPQPANWR